jgi:drug/metabolite transporter (DMT)-like permease
MRGTLIGLAAIVLWSAMVGLIRLVSVRFGPMLGVALIYSLATALLWVTRRPQHLRSFPLPYLLVGGGLFVVYEVSVGLAVGLAEGSEQALEVSIVNYLWPTFAVLLNAVTSRGRKTSWLVLPGAVTAAAGIVWVVGGDGGPDPAHIIGNVASNPPAYALALIGAVTWACYTVFSPSISRGHDGITVFFTGVAAALWIVYAVAGEHVGVSFSPGSVMALTVAAAVIAVAYACWNVGIARGDVRALSVASYATPVLSSIVGSALLGATLGTSFWFGVLLVAIGSICGWRSMRAPAADTASEED